MTLKVNAEAAHCVLCWGEDLRRIYIHETGLPLWQCGHCGLSFFLQEEKERRDYWATGGSQHNLEVYTDPAVLREERARFKGHLALIEREVPVGRLLDYGCGIGTFLGCARARGWEAYGLDISESAVAYARSQGLAAWTLADEQAPPNSGGFLADVVTMWDVIEHVDDPHKTLRFISSRLRAEGLLFLETPAAEYLAKSWSLRLYRLSRGRLDWVRYFFYPDHRYYFTKETLTQLLERNGFEIIWVRRATTSTAKVVKKLRRVHRRGFLETTLARLILTLTRLLGGNKLLVCARKTQALGKPMGRNPAS